MSGDRQEDVAMSMPRCVRAARVGPDVVHRSNLDQLDLIAMQFGYLVSDG